MYERDLVSFETQTETQGEQSNKTLLPASDRAKAEADDATQVRHAFLQQLRRQVLSSKELAQALFRHFLLLAGVIHVQVGVQLFQKSWNFKLSTHRLYSLALYMKRFM